MKKKLLTIAVSFCLSIFLTIFVYALTQEEIITLTKTGVPEKTIIEMVKSSKTTYTLGKGDEAKLKQAGVSQRVIDAMKSTLGQTEKTFEAKKGIISNILIILDSSGSMKKKTRDGKQKLASAKKALNEMVDTLPVGLNTGMIVYGHRHKADCSDIELVVSPEALNEVIKTSVKQSIKYLRPLGVTPIAASLTLAGETLKDLEGENSIILISDGKETCGGDPVKAAKELEEKYGIKVYVDVIGFDVNKRERKQLEAIATAGGGRYYSAGTAKELRLVTKKAVAKRKIIVPPPPKIVVPPPPKIKVPPPPLQKKEADYLKRGEIERGGKPIRGGKYYDDAAEIKPGKYRLDHKLRRSEYDYFKIKVRSGQRLNCSIRTTDVSKYGGVEIHSADRTKLVGETAIGNNVLKRTYYETYDLPQEEMTIYIVIGTEYDAVNEYVIYEIGLEDHFDANSTTDAGNYYDTALEVKPGKYEKNWATFGDVDMYRLNLKKGEELKVKIIPDKCNRYFYLKLINEDREAVYSARSKEKGSVVKASLVNEAEDQDIYIKADHDIWTSGSCGKYIMKIEVVKEQEEALPETLPATE